MRAVKALVIFMGLLIVLALGLLGYGVYSTADRVGKPSPVAVVSPDTPPQSATAPVTALVAVEPFGAIGLDQPPDSRIVAATPQGNLLSVQVDGGGLPDRVVLVDLDARRVLGTVHLGPSEPVNR